MGYLAIWIRTARRIRRPIGKGGVKQVLYKNQKKTKSTNRRARSNLKKEKTLVNRGLLSFSSCLLRLNWLELAERIQNKASELGSWQVDLAVEF